MAFPNKDLQVGDLLETDIGEVYAYLGYFVGKPYSYYNVPSSGNMYLFCGNLLYIRSGSGYDQSVRDAINLLETKGVECSPAVSSQILQRNLIRLRDILDGNGRYTKSYIRFKRRIGHVDIPNRDKLFQYVYGCVRLGDKKPRGYKTSDSVF